MSVESVRKYFSQWNMEDRVLEFPVSSATVAEAAVALNCKEQEIAKTMAFKVDGHAILIVTAGDAKVDNGKYKAKFHTKAAMLKGAEVEELTGHPIGGVCPFGVDGSVQVYLDVSMKRFAQVYPACGSPNSAIGLTMEELEKCSGYEEWVDVCKGWE